MAQNRKDEDADDGIKQVCRNKRAFHDYIIGDPTVRRWTTAGVASVSPHRGRLPSGLSRPFAPEFSGAWRLANLFLPNWCGAAPGG